MYDIRGLNEECGIFGIWNHPHAAHLTYLALHSLQHRGQEGAGIVCSNGEQLFGARGMGLLTEAISDAQLKSLEGYKHAIGHVRYATTGASEVSNVQPFLFKHSKGDLGLAHNGNLTNALQLRRAIESTGGIFQTTSDSEVLAHLLIKGTSKSIKTNQKSALNQMKGAFSCVILNEQQLTATRDHRGVRPLMLGKVDGAYCVASETCAFTAIGAEYIRDIEPGELITFSNEDDIDYDHYTSDIDHRMCSMEYVYFARPDSEFRKHSIYQVRKALGRQLANEMNVEADIVIGVPDSSLQAAKGFSEASGVPNEQGLLKNRYIGRTFITPNQAVRERQVRMKHAPIRDIIEGKRVVVIDDSIVRGTTSKHIVKTLKAAGAKEVHMGISSPPLKNPCYYGIDVSTHAELMAAQYDLDEIRDMIGADSLTYLSVEGMHDVFKQYGSKGECNACFTGAYPIEIVDHELPVAKELKRRGV
ncbi:amidophosphoribosyltransferase [Staphylococcus hyicus]|uniref:Amidophosphoribosyltransferase n=2 Tax=Staphylococcus hyicus TaxID=1284 RepID=A0ACD5FKY7_STAHY|nr:amidophosphoribosyltransferase [Staphylococcus hyicus]MCE5154657.1 amidophosphoribosyltransferase [Staphylococcus hyicus]MDP4447568.1 amidophosphoribosyltransferase [Staphylococcus hyicus]MDP4460476.1 amidophosphoribosyltransferase [Staphylococcus hyicus]MDP4463490.1 amidophosphoribosyltransferase [Staphylococcus hyicus]NJH81936.1 amidophosphoribosyltransferase [Staphylococcus hyicus]